MIAVPQAVRRCRQRAEVEPSALRAAVLTLTDSPEVAARCRALARELRGASGAIRAADLIEHQVL